VEFIIKCTNFREFPTQYVNVTSPYKVNWLTKVFSRTASNKLKSWWWI